MRLIIKLILCISLVPASALSQERTRKVMVGPFEDQTRIVVAFIAVVQESYRMQSLIIDLSPLKNRTDQPALVQVDLTSTDRFLSTGKKNQKILILRWKKSGEIELRCDGKWVKHDAGAAINRVIEATNAVIKDVPVDAKTPTDATLSQEVEQKVFSLLSSLHTEAFPCLRDVH